MENAGNAENLLMELGYPKKDRCDEKNKGKGEIFRSSLEGV